MFGASRGQELDRQMMEIGCRKNGGKGTWRVSGSGSENTSTVAKKF